jgi:hypothetical protein
VLPSRLLVQRDVQSTGTAPCHRPCGIDYDCGQPRGNLCLPFELIEVYVSGQESILNGIFSVSRIIQPSPRLSIERGQSAGDNFRQLLKVSLIPVRFRCSCTLHILFCRFHKEDFLYLT